MSLRKASPKKACALLDIDGTLIDTNGTQLNRALITALKKKGIKDICLFTTMTTHQFSTESQNPNTPFNRLKLIELLEKEGFNVRGVYTPMDIAFGPEAFFEKYKQYYSDILEGNRTPDDKEIKKWIEECQAVDEAITFIARFRDYFKYYDDLINGTKKITDPEVKNLIEQLTKVVGIYTTEIAKGSITPESLGITDSKILELFEKIRESKDPKFIFKIQAGYEDTKGALYEVVIANLHKMPDIGSFYYVDDKNSCRTAVKSANEHIASIRKVPLTVSRQFQEFSSTAVAAEQIEKDVQQYYDKNIDTYLSMVGNFVDRLPEDQRQHCYLNQMIEHINSSIQEYSNKGRKKHANDWQVLIKKVNNIMQSDISTEQKFDQIMRQVELALIQQQINYEKSMRLHEGSDLASFIKFIHKQKKDFEYPRMLQSILQVAYKHNPDYINRSTVILNRNAVKGIDESLIEQTAVITQKRLELQFLQNLSDILSTTERVDEALSVRQVAKINNKIKIPEGNEERYIRLADIAVAFNEDGSINDSSAAANNISIDQSRLTSEILTEHGLNDDVANSLSYKERMILESAIFYAGKINVDNEIHKVQEREVEKSGAKTEAATDMCKAAVKTVLSKIPSFNLKKITLDKASSSELKMQLWQAKFDLLVAQVEYLVKAYEKLGRSKHKNDIEQLFHNIKDTKGTNPEEKYIDALQAIQDAFNREQKHYCKPFLGLGKTKSPREFISRLNESKDNYHYPRLLGLLLQSINIAHPGAVFTGGEGFEKSQSSVTPLYKQIQVNGHPAYDNFVPSLLNNTDAISFFQFEESIKAAGFSRSEAYRLYTSADLLDVKMAKGLWSQLQDLDDNGVKALLEGNPLTIEKPERFAELGRILQTIYTHQKLKEQPRDREQSHP